MEAIAFVRAAVVVAGMTTFLAACDRWDGEPEGSAPAAEGSHEHGVARLSLAVDGPLVSVDLSIPNLSLLGFERAPRNTEERAERDRALESVRVNFAELIRLDTRLGCVLGDFRLDGDGEAGDGHDDHGGTGDDRSADHGHGHDDGGDEHEGEPEDGHSETRVLAAFTCERDPTGSTASLAFGAHFPDIERLDLRTLSSARQRALRVAAEGTHFIL